MSFVQYTCDACDAHFEVEAADTPHEGLMCPECAETELLTVTGVSNGHSRPVVPGGSRGT
jgi:DNA-directed RNA polymerase subunit RPC12/RpoP